MPQNGAAIGMMLIIIPTGAMKIPKDRPQGHIVSSEEAPGIAAPGIYGVGRGNFRDRHDLMVLSDFDWSSQLRGSLSQYHFSVILLVCPPVLPSIPDFRQNL